MAVATDHANLFSPETRLQANPLYTPELVTMICAAAGQDQTFAAFTLSRVCGSWRAIILHNRRLWSHLHVTLTNALLARNAPLLRSVTRLYLARSVDDPLHISLVDKVSYGFSEPLASSLGSFVALLNRCCHRWRTISISELGERSNYYLKTLFTPHPMLLNHSQLISVAVCLRREDEAGTLCPNLLPESFQALSLINTTPTVSSLHLVFFGRAHTAPFKFRHIRRLVFESAPDILPSLHLPSFPEVQQLSLICRPCQLSLSSAVARSPYTAERVTILIIHVTGSGQGIQNHIRSLALPSLRSACFVSDSEGPVRVGTVEVQAFHELVARSPFSRVIHLSFVNVAVEVGRLLSLLGVLPNLETLAMSHPARPVTHRCSEGEAVVKSLGHRYFLPQLRVDGVSLCGRRSRDASHALVHRTIGFR